MKIGLKGQENTIIYIFFKIFEKVKLLHVPMSSKTTSVKS